MYKDLNRLITSCWKGYQSMAMYAKGETSGMPLVWNQLDIVMECFFSLDKMCFENFHLIKALEIWFITNSIWSPTFRWENIIPKINTMVGRHSRRSEMEYCGRLQYHHMQAQNTWGRQWFIQGNHLGFPNDWLGNNKQNPYLE